LAQTGTDAGNYNLVSPTSGTSNANITPAALSVTANNDSRLAGSAYSGGNGVVYSGLVGGETAGVLTGALTYGGNSQGASAAGTYAITPGGLGSGNYAITFNNGALTLTPASSAASALGEPALVQAYTSVLTGVIGGLGGGSGGGLGGSTGSTGGATGSAGLIGVAGPAAAALNRAAEERAGE
jgi:trimeric autotransporter adhesin